MEHCGRPRPGAGRQMSLMFDADGLIGLDPADREKALTALARILMQAAGPRVEEVPDDRR